MPIPTNAHQSRRGTPQYTRRSLGQANIDVGAYGNRSGQTLQQTANTLQQTHDTIEQKEAKQLRTDQNMYNIQLKNRSDDYIASEEFQALDSKGKANAWEGFTKGLYQEAKKTGIYDSPDGEVQFALLQRELEGSGNKSINATLKIENHNNDVQRETSINVRIDSQKVRLRELSKQYRQAQASGNTESMEQIQQDMLFIREEFRELSGNVDSEGKLFMTAEGFQSLQNDSITDFVGGNVEFDSSTLNSLDDLNNYLSNYDNGKLTFSMKDKDGKFINVKAQEYFKQAGMDDLEGRKFIEDILSVREEYLKGVAKKQELAGDLNLMSRILNGEIEYNSADPDHIAANKAYKENNVAVIASVLPAHSGAARQPFVPTLNNGQMTDHDKNTIKILQKVDNGEFPELQGVTQVDLFSNYAVKTGEVPQAAINLVKQGTPDGYLMGASLYERLQLEDPQAAQRFAKALGDEKTNMLDYKYYVDAVGPEAAAERLQENANWKNQDSSLLQQRKSDLRQFDKDGDTSKFIEDSLDGLANSPGFFSGAATSETAKVSNTIQQSRYESALKASFDYHYMRTGDEKLAKINARDEVNGRWGFTSIVSGGKRLMENPPMSSPALANADISIVREKATANWKANAKALGLDTSGKFSDNITIIEDKSWSQTTLRDVGTYAYRVYFTDANGVMHDISNANGDTRNPWVPDIPTVSDEERQADKANLSYEEYRLNMVQEAKQGKHDVSLFSFGGVDYGPKVRFGGTTEDIKEAIGADIRNVKPFIKGVANTASNYNRMFGRISDYASGVSTHIDEYPGLE